MKWLNFSNILDGTAKKLSAASGKEWGTSVAIASFFTGVFDKLKGQEENG
jgi:hypothetical protein